VAKKAESGSSSWLLTTYVYDDFGSLRYVIPPIPTGTTYPTSFAESDDVFKRFIYGYHYDARRRLVDKKVPGKGWDYMVYNKLDQVVATQDSASKIANTWMYTKYDALGRTVQSGTWNNGGTAVLRAALQSSVDVSSTYWEAANGGSGTGYSASAWPTSGCTLLSTSFYDTNSNIPGFPSTGWSAVASGGVTGSQLKGLPVATKTAVLNSPSNMLLTVNYYDDRGRVVQSNTQHYLGGGTAITNNLDQVVTTYNFTGQPLTTERKHYKNVSNAPALQLTLLDTYAYDHMGRSTMAKNKVNALTEVVLSQAVYNEIGQLKTKRLHSENSGGSFLQDVAYSYNERGWLKSALSSQSLFNEILSYNWGTSPQYNGNISLMEYYGPHTGYKSFVYSYDYLNRLTSAASSNSPLTESLTYDELGNIKSIARGGVTYGTLTHAYTDNLLTGVTGSGFTTRTYAYDANGNATTAGTNDRKLAYNLLNLPVTVKNASNVTIMTYDYDAEGQKLRSESTADGTREYIGGIVYEGTAIKAITTAEGRITLNAGVYKYKYDLKDHLGNVRVTFDKNTTTGAADVVQEDEYYAFGLKSAVYDNSNGNRYLYNGKELQIDLENQYDYGARFYDPVIGRWTSVDPLADINRRWSPYNYVEDNPINLVDPDGMTSEQSQLGGDLPCHGCVVPPGKPPVRPPMSTSFVDEAGRLNLARDFKPRGVFVNIAAWVVMELFMSHDDPAAAAEQTYQIAKAKNFRDPNANKGYANELARNGYKVPGAEEEKDSNEYIYRGGAPSDGNLTPRDKDTDPNSDKRGLSTFTTAEEAKEKSKKPIATKISVASLRRLGLTVEYQGTHASIRPATQGELEKWAATKEAAGAGRGTHIYTRIVQASVRGVK
jgi:RHS repeat-associated protein